MGADYWASHWQDQALAAERRARMWWRLLRRLLRRHSIRGAVLAEACKQRDQAQRDRDRWAGHCLVVSARMLGVVRAALEADGAPIVIRGRAGEEYAAMLETFVTEAQALLGEEHSSVRLAGRVAAAGAKAWQRAHSEEPM